jgi:16S rRNA (guanine(966)-N(2))-methyltransferase RsmD
MHIISGLYKNRKILTPKGEKTRPTSGRLREALFNICQNEIEEAAFLDLFAGSGAMGLEALSRGAKQACFVDNSRESIRCIQSNLTTYDATKNGEVLFSDVFIAMKKLAKLGRQFDMIYADPPYDIVALKNQEQVSLSAQVLIVLDELIEAGQPLLKRGGILFLEDEVQALPEGKTFKHLIFKDKRVMGRSALQCWYYP